MGLIYDDCRLIKSNTVKKNCCSHLQLHVSYTVHNRLLQPSAAITVKISSTITLMWPSPSPDMGMGLVDGLGLGLQTPPLTPTNEGVILMLLTSPPLCTESVEVWSPTLGVPMALCLPGVGGPGWLVLLLIECSTAGGVWSLVPSPSLGPFWSPCLF